MYGMWVWSFQSKGKYNLCKCETTWTEELTYRRRAQVKWWLSNEKHFLRFLLIFWAPNIVSSMIVCIFDATRDLLFGSTEFEVSTQHCSNCLRELASRTAQVRYLVVQALFWQNTSKIASIYLVSQTPKTYGQAFCRQKSLYNKTKRFSWTFILCLLHRQEQNMQDNVFNLSSNPHE